MTKKITLATLKSFIRKNGDNMLVNVKSSFDGMVDGCTANNNGFLKAQPTEREYLKENNLGFAGIWVVGSGRDYIKSYNENNMKGFEVSNCCGRFIVAIAS